MIARSASSPLWFKLAALAWGVLALLWLPVEDLDLRWVSTFAAALCALAAARFTLPSPTAGQKNRPWWLDPLIGLLAGLCVPPLAVLLMIFKSGLHGHTIPDFTPDQIFSVLYQAPYWAAGGLLIGLGLGIFRKQ
jgi:hypothetical protein